MKNNDILKLNEIRRRNMLSLLRVLLEKSPLSRVELAKFSGCDNTTVTRGVRELLKRGIIITAGKQDIGHGRPREQLIINPDGKYLIGLSLEPTELQGQLTDFQGNPRIQDHVLFSGTRSPGEYLSALESMTRSLLRAAGTHLAGVGVSTFGTSLDPAGAVLHNTANFPELSNLDLRAFFLDRLSLSPCFADMMICSMNNELNRHIEERRGTAMLVHLGHGIGMSLAINGMLAFHRNQHGGELGHNICNPDGETCRCGRRGCLETYLSVDNFLRHLQQKDHSRTAPTLSEAIQRYRQHDRNCHELINESLHHLAIILANQINNISPDYLILNGSMLGFGKHFCKVLETKLRALLFEYSSQALTIVFREPGEDNCTATGAALLARDHLLDSPEAFGKYC